MIRRLPLIPTLIVLAAVAAMIALGIWQSQRAHWKAALLEHYRTSQTLSADVDWPRTAADVEGALYRHAAVSCERVISLNALSGRNTAGEAGWAHVARCKLDGAGEADVVLGWSDRPDAVQWSGGQVSGFIGPGQSESMIAKALRALGLRGENPAGQVAARLIASPPLAGLKANAPPDPSEIPNNHMAYAVQWFFFAATALAIYALALRQKWKAEPRA